MAGPRPLGSRRSATVCLPRSKIALASSRRHGPARRGASLAELGVPAAPLARAPVGPADQKDYRLSIAASAPSVAPPAAPSAASASASTPAPIDSADGSEEGPDPARVRAALEQAKWRREKAAEILGVSPRTLYRWIKKLGL